MNDEIIKKAKEYGACLAGIADVEAVKKSPSHLIYRKLDDYKSVGAKKTAGIKPREVVWPVNAKSAIVVAVQHPEDKPELDWWQDSYRGGTPGNRMLMSINAKLSEWLQAEKGIGTKPLPYHIEHGGIFLKDAAAMAGLGCIGKNNMLVTPEFGPRVRLRVMLSYERLPCTDPIDFDPCKDCPMPCREVCPQKAFRSKIYSENEFNRGRLPARTGVYSRDLCNVQMELDVDNSENKRNEDLDGAVKLVRYCRRCELACPVGKAD
jgi:epoxyqueuosine reductase